MPTFILAIDQGTTSSRAMVFNTKGQALAKHQLATQQYFPKPGWVEQNPEEIWSSTLICCQEAVQAAGLTFADIAGIGITNQRETSFLWDRKTGEVLYQAIVWQDRRGAELCQKLLQQGHEPKIQAKTGLLLDPYFSASKLVWLLDNIPGARQRAQLGELAFGTVDCFLLWRLTAGAVHATDETNACRTLLYNIEKNCWDKELLELFNIPQSLLPEVLENTANFGMTAPSLFGSSLPILAMAGDQQAALVGQTCFTPGMIKSTYGTGAFVMVNTGQSLLLPPNRMLSTIAYRINGVSTYAIEGSIFSAGSTIQWLRDKLHLIKHASETETIAASVSNNSGVYLVPAFTGLGAPYWAPNARAAIEGLTLDSEAAHIVRAALEAIAYQTRDLLEALNSLQMIKFTSLRVDGGMTTNRWLLQFLADMLNLPVARASINETTALGVSFLVGLKLGIFNSLDEISQLWQADDHFEPQMTEPQRAELYQNWLAAVQQVLGR